MGQRVLIAGSYGHGNTGDEAILRGILTSLREARPDLVLQVVSGNPAVTSERFGLEAIPWSDWNGIAAALGGADLLVLGGGGIFFDYWGFDPQRLLENEAPDLPHYASFPLLAWMFEKPLMLWACGVGPVETNAARDAVRATFALASGASVRDRESHELLVELGIAPEKVAITADPAFRLAAVGGDATTALLRSLGVSGERPLVAVAPRPWSVAVNEQVWQASLTSALATLHATTDAQILLLSFHAGFDDLVVHRLREGLRSEGVPPDDVLAIEGDRTPEEILGVIERAELVVSMRLHSLVFSMLAGRAAVALAYDPKIRQLARQAGHEEICRGLDDLSDLTELLQNTWARRAAIGADLRAAANDLRKRSEQNVELALTALEGAKVTPPLSNADQESFRRLAAAALRGRLADIAERGRSLQDKGAVVERQWRDMETMRGWLQSQEAKLQSQEAELQSQEAKLRSQEESNRDLESQLQAARARIEAAAADRERAQQRLELIERERDGVERRLVAIEDTLAYKLSRRLWSVMRRLLPEGSRRRRLYSRVRGRLDSRPAQAALAPMGGSERTIDRDVSGPVDKPVGAGRPDPWSELSSLEDLAAAQESRRAVVIVSGTHLVESEGQRPTQLARALVRQGIPVVFVYWRWHGDEWHPQERVQDGIAQLPFDLVVGAPRRLVNAFAGLDCTILFAFPHPDIFELTALANGAGWTTVYDVLDDWQEFHRVGQALWYDEPFERHLIRACDAVFAVNSVLAERVRGLGGEHVEVVGNGVDEDIATIRQAHPLSRGEVTIGYFGYLAGAWYDWDLMLEAARRRPTWRFYLIGYGGSPEGRDLPPNLVLLGKQPQRDLAAFAAHWDVAIVPFKATRLAAGADPIKVYEYLAMGLPVVTTGVAPPPGAEAFVTRAIGIDAFLESIEAAARRGDNLRQEGRAFAETRTWKARVAQLLESIDQGAQGVAVKRALFGRVA